MEEQFQLFVSNLNWTFISCYCFFVYGIKNIDDMKWYNYLFDGTKIENFKIFFAGLAIMVIQCILHYLDETSVLNAQYFAQVLRSWIFSAVLYSSIVKKVKILK